MFFHVLPCLQASHEFPELGSTCSAHPGGKKMRKVTLKNLVPPGGNFWKNSRKNDKGW